MIPASFDYVRADSVDAALAALTEHGDEAKLLAGGHSLLPLMKLRLAAPSVLVDVGRLDDPTQWREWARSVILINNEWQGETPNPYQFDDWQDWAQRFLQVTF